MARTRYIKDKNGKFKGSIGAGKSAPGAFKRFAARLTRPAAPTEPALPAMYEKFTAYRSPAVSQSDYHAAQQKADAGTSSNFTEKFNAEQSLRVKAEAYSATDEGQVEVLKDALAAAQTGRMSRALMLYKASAVGRQHRDEETGSSSNLRSINEMTAQLPKNDFDHVDAALADYQTAALTPVTVPPAGNEPGKTLPFDALRTGEAVSRVANYVNSARYEQNTGLYSTLPAKKDVYSAELIDEAAEMSRVSMCFPDSNEPNLPANRYGQFLDKVNRAHEQNQQLLTYRLDALIRAAESVAYHNSPASQEKLRNPFDF